MRLLCVADHIDPLVYSSAIKTRFKDVDLVLGAGDLPLEYYSYIVTTLNKPLLYVFGNHELKQYRAVRYRKFNDPETWKDSLRLDSSIGAVFIGDRTYRQNGLLFAGIGGCRRYNDGDNQYNELEMWFKLVRLIPGLLWNRLVHGRWLDVFLTHAPPFGIHDRPDPCHTGFQGFHWFLRWFKPRLMIHGHIHLYTLNEGRESQFGPTRIVNAYDHIVLDLPPRTPGGSGGPS